MTNVFTECFDACMPLNTISQTHIRVLVFTERSELKAQARYADWVQPVHVGTLTISGRLFYE